MWMELQYRGLFRARYFSVASWLLGRLLQNLVYGPIARTHRVPHNAELTWSDAVHHHACMQPSSCAKNWRPELSKCVPTCESQPAPQFGTVGRQGPEAGRQLRDGFTRACCGKTFECSSNAARLQQALAYLHTGVQSAPVHCTDLRYSPFAISPRTQTYSGWLEGASEEHQCSSPGLVLSSRAFVHGAQLLAEVRPAASLQGAAQP
jgi:hypothetical protein